MFARVIPDIRHLHFRRIIFFTNSRVFNKLACRMEQNKLNLFSKADVIVKSKAENN